MGSLEKIVHLSTRMWSLVRRFFCRRLELLLGMSFGNDVEGLHVPRKAAPEYRDLSEHLLEKQSEMTVLLGPWGSGKSRLVDEFVKDKHSELSKLYSIRKIELFSAQSSDHALFLTLGGIRGIWLWLVFLFLFLAYVGSELLLGWVTDAWGGGVSIQVLLGIGGLLFFVHRRYAVYSLGCAFEAVCGGRPTLLIMEDLDRSPMSFGEQRLFLSSLRRHGFRYVVPMGFSNSREHIQLVELFQKLEANIIEVPSDPKVTYEIISKLCKDFPVGFGEWIRLFETRELARIVLQINQAIPKDMPLNRRRILLLRKFHPFFVRKISSESPDYLRKFALRISGENFFVGGLSDTRPVLGPLALAQASSYGASILSEVLSSVRKLAMDRVRRDEINEQWMNKVLESIMSGDEEVAKVENIT